MDKVKKRWISIYVENEIGVLARISGLFSGKAYNIDTLSVGETEDRTVSRMTIGVTSDDKTFEQIKKQLNRSVEVIKVLDFTDIPIHMKELMFVKINSCTEKDKAEAFRIASVYGVRVSDYNRNTVLLECVQSEDKNESLLKLLSSTYGYRLEVVRSGAVAVEAVSYTDR
ncbi:MAG: acetolactate synthase small subunit [Butyrivibrio sp.]|nr:acetolactate synthase small subunit [Butyrivibrio sp.]